MYGEILQLDVLLALQRESGDVHDEHFFFAIHQVHELLFKIILYELDGAAAAMSDDDVPQALYCLRRVRAVEDVLVNLVGVVATISPGGFTAIRRGLASSSGLQSAQFREIEFVSGLKEPSYLNRVQVTPQERDRLGRRLTEPSLWDAFCALRHRRGNPDLAVMYKDVASDDDLLRLAEALLDHDEGLGLWRARHVPMVERIIGAKPGTGGSAGVSYLKSTVDRRCYPELWELRGLL
jgi:tryptophan 2,3-dioxygenase